MNYQKKKSFILLGGGHILVAVCNFLKNKKNEFLVFTSKEKLKSNIINQKFTLEMYLNNHKIKYNIISKSKDLSKKKFKKYFTNDYNIIGFSISLDFIIKKSEIQLFNDNLYNIHGSFLPDMRGAGGFTWNILMHKYTSGVSVHKINSKIDDGDILLQNKYVFPINIRNSLLKMQKFAAIKENKMGKDFIKMILNRKKMRLRKQSNEISSSWRKLNTFKDAWINWNWNVKDILTFIQAFSEPYCGASSIINNKRIFILEAKIFKSKIKFHPFQYGMIYKIDQGSLYVACNEGILKILKYNFSTYNKKIDFLLNKQFINKK